jgi:hypothetical protein
VPSDGLTNVMSLGSRWLAGPICGARTGLAIPKKTVRTHVKMPSGYHVAGDTSCRVLAGVTSANGCQMALETRKLTRGRRRR